MARHDNVSAGETELLTLVPAVITPEVLASAANIEVFMQLCRRFDFTGLPGVSYAVNQAPAMTFGALDEDGGEATETAFTTTSRTITPVQRFVDTVISKKAMLDSVTNPADAVAMQLAIALAGDRDALCADLSVEAPSTTPDHEIGADATALDFADVAAVNTLLHTQRAPQPYSGVVHPIQWGELLADTTFQSAAIKGSPVLTEGLTSNGFGTAIIGTNIYVSPEINESTGLHSMWFAPGAIGYGFKRMDSPLSPSAQELLIDIEWNSAARTHEVNATYYADFEGLRDTATTNKWMVDLIS